MYASIRQGKAKPGMAEELTRRIKEGAIPIISDVEGFRAYYVTRRYCNRNQRFQRLRGSGGVKQASAGADRAKSYAASRWASYSDCWAGHRAYDGLARLEKV